MKAFASSKIWLPFLPLLCWLLIGCGGGATTGSSTPTPAAQGYAALISFNVLTGNVTVTPGSSTSKTLFTGSTVGFSTSVLTTQAGSPGVKSTLVSLTNGSSVPLGVDPNGNSNGLRVIFGPVTVTGGSSTDLIQLSNATGTIPGNASGSNVPYINYPGLLSAGKASGPLPWNFVVPSGITAFTVSVNVEADYAFLTPPNGASGQGSSLVSVPEP